MALVHRFFYPCIKSSSKYTILQKTTTVQESTLAIPISCIFKVIAEFRDSAITYYTPSNLRIYSATSF